MAKDVTLADIAAQVGVSNVAVSKALSGKPGVSDELRMRIKQVAQQMGYIPNQSGKVTVGETGNIGVIVPEHYYGYSLSFYGQLYEKVVRALYDNRYYGILELLSKEDEEESNIPNTYMPSIAFDTVISDGYYGTYLLTNYLIRHGHKKIGFVGNVDATNSIADRFWGYRKALRQNNIIFENQWEISDRSKYGKIYDKILTRRIEMDAYVCNCDLAAYTLIQDLEELGYSVPEDVSVVGFDDFLPGGVGREEDRITSYSVDMDRMAEICVKSLIKKIKHKKYVEGVQIVAGKIVEKRTVKSRKEKII